MKTIILEVKTALIHIGENLTEIPEWLVMSNSSYSNVWISLYFSELGITVTSLTWVEAGVQVLKGDCDEKRGYQRIPQGRSSCRTALEWQNDCDFCSPRLSWVGCALRFASSDKQHPKNSSGGGTSLECPAQGRDNIPAGWGCSGLCPVTFGRALSMETDFSLSIC